MGIDLVFLSVGLLLGAAVAYSYARARTAHALRDAEQRNATLSVQNQSLLADVEQRNAAQERQIEELKATHQSALAAQREAQEELLAENLRHQRTRITDLEQAAQERLEIAQELLSEEKTRSEKTLAAERARHERELHGLRKDAEERLQELRDDQDRLKGEFARLSAEALAKNSDTFLRAATERFKREQDASQAELQKREKAVAALVDPLSKTLDKVQQELTSSQKERAEAHGQLKAQVQGMHTVAEKLRSETGLLVKALRTSQVRGRWGEMALRRVVEASGMTKHVDFDEQETFEHGGAILRPDMVVHLPGDKKIVVDAKTPFSGYIDAVEADDEAVRQERLKAHARNMRDHIKGLSEKAYWDAIGVTPEFVVMFVPAEPFLIAALETEPNLMEQAFTANVVLATPATLVALLRTVGYTWRQENLAASAQEILDVGRELYKRIGVFGERLEDLARKLNSTVDSYNKLTGSVDRRLVPQLDRFSTLQGLGRNIEVPPPLEVRATPATKELLYRLEDNVPYGLEVPDERLGPDDNMGP